jgi:hypothetical protein
VTIFSLSETESKKEESGGGSRRRQGLKAWASIKLTTVTIFPTLITTGGPSRSALRFVNMSTPEKVIITYSGPPTFLQSDHWKQVHTALSSQLPLRTLHWKSAARPSVKTIQTLDVDLVALEGVKYESTSQVPQSVLARPLLNIYVFVCEVGLSHSAVARAH